MGTVSNSWNLNRSYCHCWKWRKRITVREKREQRRKKRQNCLEKNRNILEKESQKLQKVSEKTSEDSSQAVTYRLCNVGESTDTGLKGELSTGQLGWVKGRVRGQLIFPAQNRGWFLFHRFEDGRSHILICFMLHWNKSRWSLFLLCPTSKALESKKVACSLWLFGKETCFVLGVKWLKGSLEISRNASEYIHFSIHQSKNLV